MAKLLTLVGLLCLLAALAMAAPEDRFEKSWREFRLPPFEVLVERDSNEVRAFLGDLFQYRHLLATVLPGTELRAQWPVRIWVTDQDSATVAASDGRLPVVVDRYVVLLPRNPVLTPELRRSIARTVMEDSLRPLPTWFEQGLLDLLSGVRIERQVLHLGAPPPAAQRTASWAQVHWLLTSKQSVPTLSALAGNLEKGMEERLSLRNSYQMDPAQLEAAARPALTAQSPATVEFSGLANNPRQDFRDWYVPLGYAELAAATRAALSGSGPLRQALGASRPRWGDLDVRARSQLQALDASSALQGGEEADARTILADLTAIGNTDSAWVYRQAAQLADSKAERQRLARLALEKSASWAEVYRFLASLETAPEASGKLLMEASRRDPRNQALWEETAAVLVQARDFAAADAALEGAARSARTQEEQQRLRDARWALREDRARKDEEDRQSRLADERRQIEDLKAKTMSRIEEALARANRENASADSDAQEVVDLADVDDPESVEGALVRVVCRDKETYLLEIKTTEGYIRLLLKNPSQVVTASGASWDFRCGNLVNPQVVKATYLPKVSSTLGTIGEVLSLSAP
ncbi:MAG: hypothetical protein MUF01_02915 [Bryobacterales bacterium]|jgi:hypothetical protein|nr:hypothetical protein [Bryobacterales bacterium]